MQSDPGMPIWPALDAPPRESAWGPLYKVGALSAVSIVVLMVFQLVMVIIAPSPSFTPDHAAAVAWFELLHRQPLLGLLHLDGLMLLNYVFVILLFLALFFALRRRRPVETLLSFVLCAIATAVYFTSNPAFTMLALADQYALATSDVARIELLAAAQATLAVYHGTPFDVAYVLSAVAGILICSAMFSTSVFGRPTAVIGIVVFAMNLIPATAGTLGLVLSIGSLLPLAVWLILVARRLWRLR